jgi:hypothetical protein
MDQSGLKMTKQGRNEGEEEEREEQNANHKKLITNQIPEDTRW